MEKEKQFTDHEIVWKQLEKLNSKLMAIRQSNQFKVHWLGGSIEDNNTEVLSEHIQKAKEELVKASKALSYASHHIAMDMAEIEKRKFDTMISRVR